MLAGENSADLDIGGDSSSYAFTTGKTVTDVYGRVMDYFGSTALATAAKNNGVADISFAGTLAENEAIKIDTVAPTVTITGAKYDVTAGTITISGTGFNVTQLGQTDVLEQLDWSKLKWNIDGDDVTANDVTSFTSTTFCI